jgi:site-specific DNA recombinase
LKQGAGAGAVGRISATEIEAAVSDQLRALLRSPEIIIGTWRSAKSEIPDLAEAEVRETLEQLDPLWDELFPAEQARIIQLLVGRVDVSPEGVDIQLRTEGLANLTAELDAVRPEQRAA